MDAEGEQLGSYGIATTYLISSSLEGHSSIYISTDVILVWTTGYGLARPEDSRAGLRYDISNGIVGSSGTTGLAL